MSSSAYITAGGARTHACRVETKTHLDARAARFTNLSAGDPCVEMSLDAARTSLRHTSKQSFVSFRSLVNSVALKGEVRKNNCRCLRCQPQFVKDSLHGDANRLV